MSQISEVPICTYPHTTTCNCHAPLCGLTAALRQRVADLEERLQRYEPRSIVSSPSSDIRHVTTLTPVAALNAAEIDRYSRQLLVRTWGVEGQHRAGKGRVLVIGAGGLGSPAVLYLAGAGVGTLGIVDHDVVTINNLHRQVIHTIYGAQECIGKAHSAKIAVSNLNDRVHVDVYHTPLTALNARDIIQRYDVILDCTDNVASRYLINDACVVEGKPLVSGSALRTEGQLTVYHFNNGPCYRCIFPVPPPADAVTNCSDGGVLGPVPGVIGVLQAMEALKILSGFGVCLSSQLLLYDAATTRFRNAKLRNRNPACIVCGDAPTITSATPLPDYAYFCGSPLHDKGTQTFQGEEQAALLASLQPTQPRLSAKEYASLVSANTVHLLIDVRESLQYDIVRFQPAISIPLQRIKQERDVVRQMIKEAESLLPRHSSPLSVVCLCRRGVDSVEAASLLHDLLNDKTNSNDSYEVCDVQGGLQSWAKDVDPDFPLY